VNGVNNRPLKSSEWVRNELKREIAEGRVRPGDKLPSVVELAERFGVGRSTVREALSALKAVGMLDIRQGGGTYVRAREPDPASPPLAEWIANADSLLQLVEVRRVLETGNASLAARHCTDADEADLRAAVDRMREVIADEVAGEQADTAFHLRLAEATHNPLLIELTRSLSTQLHHHMRHTRAAWFYADRRSAEQLLEEHAGIVQAVLERDENLAAERMNQHLAAVERVLRDHLRDAIREPGIRVPFTNA